MPQLIFTLTLVSVRFATLSRFRAARAGVDVSGHAAHSHVFARGPRFPQSDAVHVPRGNGQNHQPQQRAPRRGLDGRVEGILL